MNLAIAASTRSACDSDVEAPSHVLAALGLPREQASTAVRLTLLPGVTRSQARHIAKTLSKVASRYRQTNGDVVL